MGKRLTPDHPGLKRIRTLFEDHLEELREEEYLDPPDPAFDPTLNTTTYEPGKLQIMGDLRSEGR